MADLTERQTELLKAIIEEYVETAEPVGSENLVGKYDLNVSPATVRNEMVALTKKGFLLKPHTSAGRIPTGIAFRIFIRELMQEKKIPIVSETAVRQRLWEKRFEIERMLRDAVSLLAEQTSKLAVATVDEGPVYYSGVSNILNFPEFYDIDLTKTVLSLLDQHDIILDLFEKVVSDEPVKVLIGEESGISTLEPCSFVYTPYDLGKVKGYLGIVGPTRMNYPQVIPTVRFIGDLLSELTGNW